MVIDKRHFLHDALEIIKRYASSNSHEITIDIDLIDKALKRIDEALKVLHKDAEK